MKYPEIDISVIDHLNPSCGYQVRVVNGRTGEQMLYTNKNPVTGDDLLSFHDCLAVAEMYDSQHVEV